MGIEGRAPAARGVYLSGWGEDLLGISPVEEAVVPCFERPQNIFPRCLVLVNQKDFPSDVEAIPRPPSSHRPVPQPSSAGRGSPQLWTFGSLYAGPWLAAQFSSPAVGRLSGGLWGLQEGAAGKTPHPLCQALHICDTLRTPSSISTFCAAGQETRTLRGAGPGHPWIQMLFQAGWDGSCRPCD